MRFYAIQVRIWPRLIGGIGALVLAHYEFKPPGPDCHRRHRPDTHRAVVLRHSHTHRLEYREDLAVALRLVTLAALLAALVACAPTPPPSCRGPVFGMNAGQWTPTPADLQVKP